MAKSKEGFNINVDLENTVDTSYSVTMTYTDEKNTKFPATESISNYFTYEKNTECKMEVEEFVLEKLTQEGGEDTYTAEFSIMTHVSEACRNDFEAQINFLHDDKYVENFVITDPTSIYRIRDDGRQESIKLTIKNLTDITGEYYGQIEMTAAG